jgi:hypothetical protein
MLDPKLPNSGIESKLEHDPMPSYGLLDTATVAPRLPRLADLDTQSWPLPQAEILQASFEVERKTEKLLPKAMHPAIPGYVIFSVARYPESPVGPFNLAMARLAGRAAAHPRGLVLGAIASTEAAAKGLRQGWGLPAQAGEVTLTRRHDRVTGRASLGGLLVLEIALVNPEPISGTDLQYINWVTLARAPLDGKEQPLIVQVDPRYTIHKAERGRPEVTRFEAEAWNAPGVVPKNPILATISTSDTDLPRIRFVMDPEVPVFKGTRRIRESREAE